MKKCIIIILLMALSPINLQAQLCEVNNTAFKSGESVQYDLYFDFEIDFYFAYYYYYRLLI